MRFHAVVAANVILLGAAFCAAGPMHTATAAAQSPFPVTSCSTIQSPGDYALVTDLSSSSGSCLVILSPNVTLDLGGHTLQGASSGTGIQIMNAAAGTQIIGGSVSSFNTGMEVDAPNVTLSGIRAVNNVAAGVELLGATSGTVANSTITGNHRLGLALVATQDTTVVSNDIAENQLYGLVLDGTANATIRNNIVRNNAATGIYVGCLTPPSTATGTCAVSTGNAIQGNVVTDNHGMGIAVERGSTTNALNSNSALNNTPFDLADANPACGLNQWSSNQYVTRSQVCIT